MIIIKRRLNIFIDESGDFGFVDGSSDLYGVSFTIHESDDSIVNDLEYLNNRLKKANYDGMIHLADLVAKRGDYSYLKLEQRKNIFWAIFYFSKRVKVKIHTIIIDKRFKNSKFVKAITYAFKIKVVLQVPAALPEGSGENKEN